MSATEFSNKWIVCRFCLKSTEEIKVSSIFDAEEELVHSIEECTGIQLTRSNRIPESMCNKCLLLLNATKRFLKLCKISEERFKVMLELYGNETVAEKTIMTIKTESYNEQNTQLTDNDIECNTNTGDELSGDVDNNTDEVQMELQYPMEEEEFLSTDNVQECEYTMNTAEYLEEEATEVHLLDVQPVQESLHETALANSHEIANLKRKRRYQLQIKKEKSSDDFTFICSECGNVYNERAKLTLHMKIHNKVKPHACEICGKTFAQTPQLARHMNSHTGHRPYKCQYCNSSFADPSTCVKHQRIHTNERPYKCEICNKAFAYSNVLKVHLQTHTGEKPYECRFCGKKFTQVHHMRSHERTHRNRADDLNVDDSSSESTVVT